MEPAVKRIGVGSSAFFSTVRLSVIPTINRLYNKK